MIRFLFSLIAGGAVTFGLFYFMAFLISGGADRNTEQKEQIIVEIMTNPPESKVQERKRVPPPPPPPPKQPPKPQPPQPENSNPNTSLSFNMPSIDVGSTAGGLSGPGAFGRDGDATPIVRIEPKYPTQAARDGKEGWVQLSFTIDELGGVIDVDVIDADPKRIFDREAKRALRKWKYRPKIIDGKPQKQVGLQVQLDFKLNQGN